MNNDRESLFAEVTRRSQEKRAQSDRRAVTRRAAEAKEISKQIAARIPILKPKAPEEDAPVVLLG